MYRALNKYESLLWLMGREEPFLIQWVLMVSGDISKQHVEKALALVQRQHPLLNCSVNSILPFEFKPINKPIRLTLHQREHEKTWEKYAVQALGKRLPLSEEETFLTVDWVSDANQHEFIFTIDHGLSDARCLSGIGCDFLLFLDQLIGGKQNIVIKAYPMLPPVDTLLPKDKPEAPEEKMNVAWGDATALLAQAPYQYKLPYVCQFSEQKTSQLITATRQNQCSVHAILCAAMTHALNDYLLENSYQDETFCFTPADVRSYLDRNITAKELGNFAGGIFHPFRVGEVMPLWQLSTTITQQIQQAFTTDRLAKAKQNFASLMQDGITAKELVNSVKIRDACVAVSNVGVIALPAKFNHFQLHQTQFGSASPIMSGRGRLFWLVVETVNGRLQLEFLRTNPHDELDYVPKFAERVVAILDSVII